ncbi:amidohydrolase family protein [Eudoraea chungangensis]|uniref:amidohydrolase family protein n=1 Tax=Eudoraea chungangensis TaxID=1481905 RepID=UPI0023EDAA10|nr:amidohydrolase family protein [Eudoraea chungangensis]
MIIDSHHHLWKYKPETYPWITEDMKILRADYLPQILYPLLKANGVDACVAVQADQSEKETDFLLKCASENEFIKGVVGWIDLKRANREDRLAYFAADKNLKGIRHVVQDEPDPEFMLEKEFQNGIQCLANFNLTYDILIYDFQLPAAVLLARAFPNQKFVLDHIAKPKLSEGVSRNWSSQIKELSLCDNVSCKISGMVTETKDFQWSEEEFTPFMEVVLEAFGSERLMYGSDWPVCLLAAKYPQVINIVQKFVSTLTKSEQDNIMGLNAKRFYEL